MVTATSSVTAAGASNPVSSPSSTLNAADSQDRFLKLLVAQLSNQDPMNPLDNAQLTTQMAQISTVSSIEKVNQNLSGMSSQLTYLQTMQGSSLVNRQVLVEGSQLALIDGKAAGAIDLDLPADKVVVDILSASGQVIDSLNLGAQGAGRHNFAWDASNAQGLGATSFRVSASKATTPVTSRSLVLDRVLSVGIDNGSMNLQLQNLGSVGYGAVRAIL